MSPLQRCCIALHFCILRRSLIMPTTRLCVRQPVKRSTRSAEALVSVHPKPDLSSRNIAVNAHTILVLAHHGECACTSPRGYPITRAPAASALPMRLSRLLSHPATLPVLRRTCCWTEPPPAFVGSRRGRPQVSDRSFERHADVDKSCASPRTKPPHLTTSTSPTNFMGGKSLVRGRPRVGRPGRLGVQPLL